MEKTLIRGGFVATSQQVFRGDALVENGIIAQVGEALPADGAEIVEAEGMYLLPGGVDPHTHFDLDVGSTRASDDFYTGTVAAACGGTTTVIDHMAFGPKGCGLAHQVGVYHKLAERAVVDYGFHGVIQHVNPDILGEMRTLRDKEGITSHKVYLTYAYKLSDGELLQVLERARELGLTICAHCENDGTINLLRERFVGEGKTQPRYHPLSRPPETEAEAVYRMLSLAAMAGNARIYVVHLSTGLGLEVIRAARTRGQPNVFCETCPQYLLLDDRLYEDDREGLKYIMCPPLRGSGDLASLWQGLKDGVIDTIGTDHCPFFFATQKQAGAENFTLCPTGAPGVELRMEQMFSASLADRKLTLPQMVRTCCTAPAESFGVAPRKGDVRPGADGDLVLIDPEIAWTVTQSQLHEHVDYTPYEGMRLQGKITQVFSRGERIVRDGVFSGKAGRGRYLRRG